MDTSVSVTNSNKSINKLFESVAFPAGRIHFYNSLNSSEDRNMARSIHGLALVKELSGGIGQALEGHEKALLVLREAFKGRGGRHRDLAKSLISVGDCQRKLGNLEKAQGGNSIE